MSKCDLKCLYQVISCVTTFYLLSALLVAATTIRTLPFGIYFYLCCFIYRPSAHKTPSTLKEMDGQELIAYAILLSYFLLIFLSFGLVFRSLVAGIQLDKLFNGRPFFFLRSSIGALLCTWYCELYVIGFSTDFLCPVMIQFMNVRDKRTPIRDNN